MPLTRPWWTSNTAESPGIAQGLQRGLGLTALQRQLRDLCTGVGDVGVAVRLLDDPGEVLFDVGGVDAQEKMLRSHAIDGEVIDDPP